MKEKKRLQYLEELNVILNRRDPIGVVTDINSDDEYQGYRSGILQLLIGGAGEREVREYLWRSATLDMGMSPSNSVSSDCDRGAGEICQWWRNKD